MVHTLFLEDHMKAHEKKTGREGTKWKGESAKFREALNVTEGTAMWETTPANLRAVPTSERKRDVIQCAYLKALAEGIPVNGALVDLSLVHTRALKVVDRLRGFTSNSDYYSFGKKRTLLAEEYGALMGFYHPTVSARVAHASRSLKLSGPELKALFSKSIHVGQIGVLLSAFVSEWNLLGD